MGYYTEYTLEARKVKSKERFDELNDELKKRDLIGYVFSDGTYPATKSNDNKRRQDAIFYSCDTAKWYDHSADMIMISEKFPEMYFELTGIGEEFGDFWKEYYHDGIVEMCRGEIVYEQPRKVQWQELIQF